MPDDKKKFKLEFEIKDVQIPDEVYEKFTEAQASIFGVHGWIMRTKQGTLKVVLEGEKAILEKMKTVLQEAEKLRGEMEKAVYKELKEIDKYSNEKFEIRKEK